MAFGDGGRSKCGCTLFFSLGLSALFLWLQLRVTSPHCSLVQFYIPSLNRTLNSTKDTNLTFGVAFKNTNKDKGVYYGPINLTFFDSPNKSHSVGNYIIPRFYQGHKKKALKNGTLEASGIDRRQVFRAVSPNGSAVFHVDLAASVRYKIIFWKTKKHKIRVGGNVEVYGNGSTVNSKKGIKLKSTAQRTLGATVGKWSLFWVNLAVVILINFLQP